MCTVMTFLYLSRLFGKPTICICKNKDADQLRGNREADQRLCFRYSDSTLPLLLNPKFQISSHLLCLYSPVCVGPVRKPHCWFSHEVAQFYFMYSLGLNCFCSLLFCLNIFSGIFKPIVPLPPEVTQGVLSCHCPSTHISLLLLVAGL